jgi:hypothetical protein
LVWCSLWHAKHRLILKLEAGADNAVAEFAVDSSIRQSFLKGVLPAQVSITDLDGDGHHEMIVARTGYARSLRVAGDDFEMVDQFNARRSGDAISAVLPEVSVNGEALMGLYVASSGELQLLAKDADGVYRYSRTETLGEISLVVVPEKIGGAGEQSYVMAGEDRFWLLRSTGAEWIRDLKDPFETDLENVRYTHAEVADLNGDGVTEIIAVDGQNHVVEILQAEGAGWRSLMYWEVFEQNMHYQGRAGGKLEPRELSIAELTGDGHLDFVFLIHDRILLYPQE